MLSMCQLDLLVTYVHNEIGVADVYWPSSWSAEQGSRYPDKLEWVKIFQ